MHASKGSLLMVKGFVYKRIQPVTKPALYLGAM